MISMKQIQYALAVSRTLHFKNAAQQCSISQSALSTAITEMESQLGVQIFERDTKKVLITAIGQEILEHAKSIDNHLQMIQQIVQTQQDPLSQSMSIGVIPTISPYLLPIVLPAVHEKFPQFAIHILEEKSSVLIEMLGQGELDVAILALPYPTHGLHTFKFWEEQFYAVLHKDDPQAHQTTISADELKQHRMLLLQDGHCLKDQALAICKDFQQDQHAFSGTSLNTLVQMVAGKMGTTLVPEMALKQLVDNQPDVVGIPITEPGPHRTLAFACRLNYTRTNSIETLIKVFAQALNLDGSQKP